MADDGTTDAPPNGPTAGETPDRSEETMADDAAPDSPQILATGGEPTDLSLQSTVDDGTTEFARNAMAGDRTAELLRAMCERKLSLGLDGAPRTRDADALAEKDTENRLSPTPTASEVTAPWHGVGNDDFAKSPMLGESLLPGLLPNEPEEIDHQGHKDVSDDGAHAQPAANAMDGPVADEQPRWLESAEQSLQSSSPFAFGAKILVDAEWLDDTLRRVRDLEARLMQVRSRTEAPQSAATSSKADRSRRAARADAWLRDARHDERSLHPPPSAAADGGAVPHATTPLGGGMREGGNGSGPHSIRRREQALDLIRRRR